MTEQHFVKHMGQCISGRLTVKYNGLLLIRATGLLHGFLLHTKTAFGVAGQFIECKDTS